MQKMLRKLLIFAPLLMLLFLICILVTKEIVNFESGVVFATSWPISCVMAGLINKEIINTYEHKMPAKRVIYNIFAITVAILVIQIISFCEDNPILTNHLNVNILIPFVTSILICIIRDI